jgi:hypothetical protein
VLPWDFRVSFPEPLQEELLPKPRKAEDRLEVIRQFHAEQVRQAMQILRERDWLAESRGLGIDPNTGESKAEPAEAELQEWEAEERLKEKTFERHISRYAEAFGTVAAEAFRTAIRVWHMDGVVISELPPQGRPLAESVRHGRFGFEEDGTQVIPDGQEVREITENVADYLRDLTEPTLREELLGQYAGDFGREAAASLDEWSRLINRVEEEGPADLNYDPGHPWHYYRQGDAAEPPGVDEIPPGPVLSPPKLPKNPRKRTELQTRMLQDQEKQLSQDCARYIELVENGAKALSDFDRNMAPADDAELGWASAVALKYNHIRFGKGRVLGIRQALDSKNAADG